MVWPDSPDEIERLKNQPLDEVLKGLARARGVTTVTPITSVGPEAYPERMGSPHTISAEASADLDGIPEFRGDTHMEGYVIRGRVVPNGTVKAYVLEQVAAGKSLPSIVDENRAVRFPSLFTLRRWVSSDPAFNAAFKEAKLIRGERLGEQALDEAVNAVESNAKSAKLKHEALSRHAARLNPDYQDKQVVETKLDPIQTMPMQDAVMRLQALLSIPEVARQLKMQGLPVTLEAETPRIAITKPYEDPMDAATPEFDPANVKNINFEEEE